MKKLFVIITACFSLSAFSSEGVLVLPNDDMPHYNGDRLTVSMQNGMQVYMNNCMGCHSLKFQRYNRSARDLEIPEQVMLENLMFTAEKIGDPMANVMPAEKAENWFGTAPPDLSLIARSRSPHWLYNYLRGFYIDGERPYGVNNSVFQNVGMPHALETMQGLQDKSEKVKGLEHDIAYAHGAIATAKGKQKDEGSSKELNQQISDAETVIHKAEQELISLSTNSEYFTLIKPGKLTPDEFDQSMVDLVNFLEYIGEPIKREREKTGIWVLLFILGFGFVAYLLKKEYWKDIH